VKRKILALGAAALIATNIVSVTAGRPYACQPSGLAEIDAQAQATRPPQADSTARIAHSLGTHRRRARRLRIQAGAPDVLVSLAA